LRHTEKQGLWCDHSKITWSHTGCLVS